jgi:hypothetical protein
MTGLLMLAVGAAWLMLCIRVAKGIGVNFRSAPARALLGCVVFAGLLVAPIADDVLGARQYEKLCASANEVSIVGTIAVNASTGLYSESGEWRLASLPFSQHDERDRVGKLADSLVRWDEGPTTPVPGLFAITERTTRIYEARSDRLLVEWKSYHYRGGFLRSHLLDSASQCFPRLVNDEGNALYKSLLVFQRS